MRDKIPTFIILLICMTSNSFGDVLLSRTMSTLGEVDLQSIGNIMGLAQSVLSQGSFWLAILFLTVFFGLWMYLLSKEDVSFIMPMTAITYVISALLAGPMLGEVVTPQRWAGTLLIVLGVGVVASTGTENKATQNQEAPAPSNGAPTLSKETSDPGEATPAPES